MKTLALDLDPALDRPPSRLPSPIVPIRPIRPIRPIIRISDKLELWYWNFFGGWNFLGQGCISLLARSTKAAQNRRTPKPDGRSGAFVLAIAFWSAAVLRRFFVSG
jgi:hypothetical protein